MEQIIDTMGTIKANAHRITDIVGVIDGIAFQTNLLALNAAVEAVRAGEQGRGFAVVAGEVRALAHRSAEAAKEIKALIDASASNIKAGSRTVNDAGLTIGEIVCQTRRVSDLIDEISKATNEQSEEITQIGKAVTDMDTISRQNAQEMTQSAAASARLQRQAQQLVEAIGVFR